MNWKKLDNNIINDNIIRNFGVENSDIILKIVLKLSYKTSIHLDTKVEINSGYHSYMNFILISRKN